MDKSSQALDHEAALITLDSSSLFGDQAIAAYWVKYYETHQKPPSQEYDKYTVQAIFEELTPPDQLTEVARRDRLNFFLYLGPERVVPYVDQLSDEEVYALLGRFTPDQARNALRSLLDERAGKVQQAAAGAARVQTVEEASAPAVVSRSEEVEIDIPDAPELPIATAQQKIANIVKLSGTNELQGSFLAKMIPVRKAALHLKPQITDDPREKFPLIRELLGGKTGIVRRNSELAIYNFLEYVAPKAGDATTRYMDNVTLHGEVTSIPYLETTIRLEPDELLPPPSPLNGLKIRFQPNSNFADVPVDGFMGGINTIFPRIVIRSDLTFPEYEIVVKHLAKHFPGTFLYIGFAARTGIKESYGFREALIAPEGVAHLEE